MWLACSLERRAGSIGFSASSRNCGNSVSNQLRVLGRVAQVAAGLAVDPVGHVDPAGDLVRPLAIPGQVFRQVAVALGRIDAEALQDVDAHLFLLRENRMRLEGGDQLVLADLAAVDADIDEPGLVVDAGADVVELAVLGAEDFGDLLAAVLDAVAEADRIDLAIFDRRPGVHRHRVGIVEEFRAGSATSRMSLQKSRMTGMLRWP